MAKGKASSNGTTTAETTSVVEVQLGEQGTKTTTTEQPAVRVCECGCGTALVGKKALWAIGHDMRRKSALLTRYDQGDEAAGAELIARGWRSQADLDARRDKASGKAAASAQSKRQRLTAKLERAKAEVARLEQQLMALGS